jgi:hypothetical protein
MFVVGTVQRVVDPKDSSKFDLVWPVMLEDETQGFVGGTVGTYSDRDSAGKVADALNKVLAANT